MERKKSEPNNSDMIPWSHEERREACIPIIPDVIIFEILVFLPGDILYNVMRYVCRSWYAIIEHPFFVSKHLMLSACTLLVPSGDACFSEYRLFYGLPPWETSDFKRVELLARPTGFRVELPRTDGKRVLLSSCNGLLLWKDIDMDKKFEKIYYVGNPVMRRVLPLPPLSEFMSCDSEYGNRCCSLAFAASSKAYKVLVVYKDLRYLEEPNSYMYLGCSILTLGIDKAWRELNLTHLNQDDIKFLIKPPLSTTSIIYWANRLSSYILALDVESECIKRIPLPCAYGKNNYLLPRGNSITFWKVNQDLSMEAWVLKNHRTEEWVMLLYLASKPIRYAIERFLLHNRMISWPEYYGDEHPLLNCITVQPRGWLENIETILLYIDGHAPGNYKTQTFFVFDRNAGTCTECGVNLSLAFYRLTPFINSLAWI